jgi:hypothetical protein
MLGLNLIPQPLFADGGSMIWSAQQYFRAYPGVQSFLCKFKEFDVDKDFTSAREFLSLHNLPLNTYNCYRGIVEKLLLWSWIHAKKPALQLTRQDIADFLAFYKNPPPDWIGNSPRTRFINDNGDWDSNPDWRPMCIRQASGETVDGNVQTASYQPNQDTLRQLLSICNSFYKFLYIESMSDGNPVAAVRRQGRASHRVKPSRNIIRAQLLELIMRRLERQALGSPDGERTLFIIAAALYLYLRISDLGYDYGHCPTMSSFIFDAGTWWFIHSDRNPPARSRVNAAFLQYLTRYRVSRGLSPLPESNEDEPLLETVHGRGGLGPRCIIKTVKSSLAEVHRSLLADGYDEADLEVIKSLTLRWFRESGAKLDSVGLEPVELGKALGGVNPEYVYSRYYLE